MRKEHTPRPLPGDKLEGMVCLLERQIDVTYRQVEYYRIFRDRYRGQGRIEHAAQAQDDGKRFERALYRLEGARRYYLGQALDLYSDGEPIWLIDRVKPDWDS